MKINFCLKNFVEFVLLIIIILKKCIFCSLKGEDFEVIVKCIICEDFFCFECVDYWYRLIILIFYYWVVFFVELLVGKYNDEICVR